MKKILSLVAAALVMGLSSLSAQALTATGTFPVTINFTSTCSISTAGLAPTFTYTSLQATAAAATGVLSFTVTCTNTAPYTLSLDAGGTGYTGTYTAPTGSYTDTASGLAYTLTLPTTTAGIGAAQTYSLSGSMAAGQAGTCGTLGGCSFVDNHTLTVTY